jgi:hypothetical protein
VLFHWFPVQVIVPEGVNTTLFDPAKHAALDLTSKAQLVFGRPWRDKQLAAASPPPAAAAAAVEASHASRNATSPGNGSSTASSWDGHPGSTKAVIGAPGSNNNNISHRPFRFISTFKVGHTAS